MSAKPNMDKTIMIKYEPKFSRMFEEPNPFAIRFESFNYSTLGNTFSLSHSVGTILKSARLFKLPSNALIWPGKFKSMSSMNTIIYSYPMILKSFFKLFDISIWPMVCNTIASFTLLSTIDVVVLIVFF